MLEEFNRKRAAPHQLPDRELFAGMAESRRLAAQLIGASPEEIGLTINTGFGLSLAARALPLEAGDIVLTSDREFPANVYPWMMLKDSGITLELTPNDCRRMAGRGSATGAPPRSSGAGTRDLTGTVQQRLHR